MSGVTDTPWATIDAATTVSTTPASRRATGSGAPSSIAYVR
jgi:hypothetical protein